VITVEVAASADDDLCAAVAALIPQLSSSSPPPTVAQLARIIGDKATTLLLARDSDDGDRVVGTLTLAVFEIPTGVRAIIEDVVTDEASRGQGVGGALVQAALEQAADQGAKTVDLTSRPDREAANRLYLRMGFEQRQTNVYRYALSVAR
jgi:ribosomal protein S18 acetylase RimI-like enzyme